MSGYGKTHLARVYTRHNKAIYIKFSDRTSKNSFYTKIVAMINSLKSKYLPDDPEERSGKNYLDFTNMARLAIEIFLLAAIEHYVFFYYKCK